MDEEGGDDQVEDGENDNHYTKLIGYCCKVKKINSNCIQCFITCGCFFLMVGVQAICHILVLMIVFEQYRILHKEHE